MSLPPRSTSRPRCRAERARIRLHSISGALGAVVALLATVACKSDSTSPPVTDECTTGGATTMAVGAVTSPLTGTSLCASGGAEYVLIPFNSDTAAAKVSFDVTATGVGTVGPPLSVLPAAAGSAGSAQLSISPAVGRNPAFEARLRAREAALAPLIPAARRRAALRDQRSAASRAVIPSVITVGQRLELNTNSNDACANPTIRIGRAVAVTNKSVVVADTTNPPNGFSDADYQSIAETFDNVVDPLMTANFGAPADIDRNSRILLFFTRSVNELTPDDPDSDSYVGGFFFGRDLFPTTTTQQAEGCASSNFGEMFYLLVPDPTGIINGNTFSTAEVREIAVSIVAHEYQHLINASRRMYVSTTAEDFEETWLNEGLSHVAEELMFYADAQKQPRQDLNQQSFSGNPIAVDAFNSHAGANFARFAEFLEKPADNSPYGDNDSLATRGATWSFLRYAVDRKNTVDRNLWFQLVNSVNTGMANLQEVFGPDLTGVFRDWSTAAIADNLPGVAGRYQQPSWNFRSIYAAIQAPSYPLATVSLTAGTPRNVQIVGGGSAYLRFAVPAGGAGEVTWGTVPATMQMTLMRTR